MKQDDTLKLGLVCGVVFPTFKGPQNMHRRKHVAAEMLCKDAVQG